MTLDARRLQPFQHILEVEAPALPPVLVYARNPETGTGIRAALCGLHAMVLESEEALLTAFEEQLAEGQLFWVALRHEKDVEPGQMAVQLLGLLQARNWRGASEEAEGVVPWTLLRCSPPGGGAQ